MRKVVPNHTFPARNWPLLLSILLSLLQGVSLVPGLTSASWWKSSLLEGLGERLLAHMRIRTNDPLPTFQPPATCPFRQDLARRWGMKRGRGVALKRMRISPFTSNSADYLGTTSGRSAAATPADSVCPFATRPPDVRRPIAMHQNWPAAQRQTQGGHKSPVGPNRLR